MIKRISLIILCVILLAFASISAAASSQLSMPRVYDEDGLLTSTETAELTEKLDTISTKYNCDVVVVTVETLGYLTPAEYSEELYDTLSYGLGETDSCVMLLVCIEERDFDLASYGDAKSIFTSFERDVMVENFKPYLSDNDFYGAFTAYAEDCESILYDYYTVGFEFSWVFLSAVVGVVIAFIAVLIMKSQLKSVRFQHAAHNYLKNGSLNLTTSRDIFLYSTISRTPKPKDTSSSSGGGSHSSGSHTSGKF